MKPQSDAEKGKSSTSLFALNESAAQAFADIASYLQLKGENPFKVKAYVKASRVLRELEDDLEVLCSQGELRTIPGVGKTIADKLEEFLSTGSISQLDALRDEIPEGLVVISSLPGLGAKKTVQLHKELGVSNLEELQAALRDGKVEEVKGFSKKSQQKLLQTVDKAMARTETYLKSRLEEWAAQTLERLSGVSGGSRVEIVGGVRRLLPEADMLELLIHCEDKKAALSDVEARLQGSGGNFEAGADVLSFRHPSGCPTRIHFCALEDSGVSSLRLTGPQSFVDAFVEKGGRLDAKVASEAELFALFNLPVVAPELRHLPRPWEVEQDALLTLNLIKGNLHAHTTDSDGVASLSAMVEAAQEQGHSYFGVTDHSRSLVIANGLTPQRLLEQIERVRKLDGELEGFRVFAANETDILEDGRLDFEDDVLGKLDYVVAAVHSFFHHPQAKMTERILKGLSHPKVRIFAHPTGRLLTRRDGYQADWEQIFKHCANHHIALEINSSPWRLDISEDLLRLALELDCLIAINTDAHSIEEMTCVRHGVDMARRSALQPRSVVNTWTASVLEQWFSTGQRPDPQ